MEGVHMTTQHRGRQSICFASPPSIKAAASVVGKKEGEGPLKTYFDLVSQDTKFAQSSWEKAENQMQKLALQTVLKKASLTNQDLAPGFRRWAFTAPVPPWPSPCSWLLRPFPAAMPPALPH